MNQEIKLKVTKVQVLLTFGPDQISVHLDCPTPFPNMGYEPIMDIKAQYDGGVVWCREVLGIEPDEIINVR